MAKTSPVAIQATDETKKRLDEIAEQSGISKTELLPRMIDAWETANIMQRMPGRSDEIKQFDAAVTQIKAYYRSSLVMALTADEAAMAKAENELKTHVKTIADLQGMLELAAKRENTLKAEKDELEGKLFSLVEENAKLKSIIDAKDAALQSNADMVTILSEIKKVMEQKAKPAAEEKSEE